jgi:hypothetical protein
MSVSLPIVTRGIWIPDPCFTYPVELGKYWIPGTSLPGNITPRYWVEQTAGRGIACNVEPAGTSFSTSWELVSSYSPSGVAAGPHTIATLADIRFRVFVIAYTSGGWSTGSGLMQAYVRGYDADGTGTTTSNVIALVDSASAGLGVTHTSWTLFSGTATMATNTDTRHYKLALQMKDGTGTGARYINICWAGLAVPIEASGSYEDRLDSWYEAAPSLDCRQLAVQGRPAIQQIVTLGMSQLSDNDRDQLQGCAYWNMRTPTDDCLIDVVNRGTASPVIVALDRPDVKKAFYADTGGGFPHGPVTGGGQMWLESSNLWQSTMTFSERIY